ncbi:glypican-6-like [Amphibalanus amphitrite]|uniref:glypican-6-like n=1 Tax=Amphibalanus amphitrite TaxID=1232801 RepID=UPI001C925CDA|nr:glypican-6-like [Amphibalanus amphitrite]
MFCPCTLSKMKQGLCMLLVLMGCYVSVTHGDGLGCERTARAFANLHLPVLDIPQTDIPGDHLEICSAPRTCCTEAMELQLSELARRQLDDAVQRTVGEVADDLGSQGSNFDEFFRGMMNESRASLDAMFKKTYGVLYERNAHVFTDLFKQLELYYATGSRDLVDVMNEFFTVLYKRMFTVLNAQHTFDDKYLQCVATHMEGLKPFRDVPAKLTQQLKRSFVATRTLVQSLHTGHEVVNRLKTVTVTPSCGRAMTKMAQCGTCSGMPRVKPCHGLCLNVAKGCLAYHSMLNNHWHEFIDGVSDLVTRLEGPFNIESVVNPINVKISYAIMNFQDNGFDVSRKIFEGCGEPKLRRRRQAGGDAPSYDAPDFKRVQLQTYSDSGMDAEPSPLLRVLGQIRSRVRPLKTFWYDLPGQLCNDRDLAAPPARIVNCWNGTAKYRYEHAVTKDGPEALSANPEVPFDPLYTNSDVNEAILDLKRATMRLRDAYNGQTVTWEQPESSSDAHGVPLEAGSGSGDGAGYDVDAEMDDDDYDSLEGSGGRVADYGDYDDEPTGDGDFGRGSDLDNDYGNNLDNTVDFETVEDTNRLPDSTAGDGLPSGAHRPRMSFARAVTILVCPTLVAWIGTFI